jgi:hypothetical protein
MTKLRMRRAVLMVSVVWIFLMGGATVADQQTGTVILDNLDWSPKWTSHMGCLIGCLNYLKVTASEAWVYGATGHAFVLNIAPDLCPSGPTAFNTFRIFELAENVGCRLEKIEGHKSQDDFEQTQKLAWDKVRQALAAGHPCYAWELDMPEYFVICGHDEHGYHYRGVQTSADGGPREWDDLGHTGIGFLEVIIVQPGEAADHRLIVKNALEFAIDFNTNAAEWTFDGYAAGLAGYDVWIKALQKGKADGMGTAYNAAVWAECRQHAAAFLEEAKEKLGKDISPLLAEAVAHYREVSDNLLLVAEVFPFFGVTEDQRDNNVKNAGRCKKAIACLTKARDAETAGLAVLEKIVAAL